MNSEQKQLVLSVSANVRLLRSVMVLPESLKTSDVEDFIDALIADCNHYGFTASEVDSATKVLRRSRRFFPSIMEFIETIHAMREKAYHSQAKYAIVVKSGVPGQANTVKLVGQKEYEAYRATLPPPDSTPVDPAKVHELKRKLGIIDDG